MVPRSKACRWLGQGGLFTRRFLHFGNWKHSRLCDSVTGDVRAELPAGTIRGVFSPDGKLLAVGTRAYKAPRKLLRLIDATTGELVREFKGEGEGW